MQQSLKNLKEFRGLQGRLAYICRFIVNLSGHCQPFMRLMKKDVSFIWDDTCQKLFEDIKAYFIASQFCLIIITFAYLSLIILYLTLLFNFFLIRVCSYLNEKIKIQEAFILSLTYLNLDFNLNQFETKRRKGYIIIFKIKI